ncbi:NAD(P)/FAD-dependent oxidoreductase [Zunongwangia sp. SCSIO 43204]|uniref:phytoene desaturase family protein n=1 Tax=Zunongwangia sp. SCSIO 43204 TaxID=2779359 RepID=UPI001CA851B6|nr:NAD(P)/FAD-dependent oxidoreductase [Zunongwangia sp. SCSIO 43204]UAB84116.1 NAD(P)/FAD-dependent oxidoreductase [Zunongwangia sp. SCSIO 43204]
MGQDKIEEKYDAVIVGSGANGISAAIHLQQKGLKTLILEKNSDPGGATRSGQLTLPGYVHDIGSAVLPMSYSSPFFQTLPLEKYGLEWIFPEIAFAQTLENGEAVGCYRDISKTAANLGKDKEAYEDLMNPLVSNWAKIDEDILSPFGIPSHPLQFLKFGIKAILPAKTLVNHYFKEDKAKSLFYGAAAHSTLPLTNLASSSFGLVLSIMAHINGWPFPKHGASAIIKALLAYYEDLGGKIHCNYTVKDAKNIPNSKIQLFDLTPRQLLKIEGLNLGNTYQKRLSKFTYGSGVFKIDWALNHPIPFNSAICRRAGTVHIGYGSEEIEHSEALSAKGKIAEHPYILLVQPSIFDSSRAPEEKHTAWAYCHVPNGSTFDCTKIIEDQIEKAAPGFKKSILKRSTMNTSDLEVFNPNLVGGDINGGRQDITQLFTRPIAKISPYKTSNNNIYLCSSSTPPGGGVHGMAGFNAAKQAFKDHF